MSNIISSTDWKQSAIQQIASAMRDIESRVMDAAKVYVESVSRDPEFPAALAAALPSVPRRWFRMLERVGRGQIDQRLVTGVPHVLRLEHLPMSEQRRALDGQLPLLASDGSELLVRLQDLTVDKAEQIFAQDHIRPVEEQRIWIEQKRDKVREKGLKRGTGTPLPTVNQQRKTVTFHGPVTLSVQELMEYARKAMG